PNATPTRPPCTERAPFGGAAGDPNSLRPFAGGRAGLRPAQIVVLERQGADAFAGRLEDRVAESGGDGWRAGLADAAPFAAARQREMRFDDRHLGHAQHLIAVEIALLDAPR